MRRRSRGSTQNRALLAPCPRVVWLTARPETSYARMTRDATTAGRRPEFDHGRRLGEAIALVAQREPWYRVCAKLVSLKPTSERPSRRPNEIVAALGIMNC